MKNRKVLCLLLSLVLVLTAALPGTLAFSTDAAGTEDAHVADVTVPNEGPEGTTPGAEEIPEEVAEAVSETTDPTEVESAACTECGQTEGHAETCSQYTAPATSSTESTADTATVSETTTPTGEEETTTPTVPAETAAPVVVLMGDELAAYLLSLPVGQALAEFNAISGEQYDSLSNEQLNAVLAYVKPTSAYNDDETEDETPVPSQIIFPSVPFVNAGPFFAPVEGVAPSLFSSRKMARDTTEEPDNGLVTNKTVSDPDADGVYTLSLEAYATGEKVLTEISTEIPTDVILVLDQSGSMDESFSSVTNVSYTRTYSENSVNYNNRHNNGGRSNLWYQLSDGSYVAVSVERSQIANYTYTNIEDYYTNWWGEKGNYTNSDLYSDIDNLYCQINGTYTRVYVERSGSIFGRSYRYYYRDNNNNEVTILESDGADKKPDFGGTTIFYRAQTNDYQYTYYYTDASGNRVEIETSTGQNTVPNSAFYQQLSESTTVTRLEALKNAVNAFRSAVETKAAGADGEYGTEDDIDHRIAVVGFASGDRFNGTNYNYQNTEVFVGSNQYKYGSSAQSVYASAFQDMSTDTGRSNVAASINSLDANGGTLINLGMEMANGILAVNPVPASEKRNRVVIVFTDGAPGWSGYDSSTANSAVSQANTAKNTYGATVYTVGIFQGADPNGTSQENTFMRNLSSGSGYYLTATNIGELNSIFEKISQNIESGGSSVTLDEQTVVRDVIADSFELPEGTTAEDIKVYTADYTGENTFTNKQPFNAEVAIGEDGRSVTVTNFDYSENWCGAEKTSDGTTVYRGKKLIIEIPIVVCEGFLGGNQVPTNAEGSAVYANDQDLAVGKAFEEFVSPIVDVNIHYDFGYTNQSIYLGNRADLAALYEKKIELNGKNNGYVNIVYELRDTSHPGSDGRGTLLATMTINAGETTGTWKWEDGAEAMPMLTDDNKYSISCTVSPTATGTAQPYEKNVAPEVYVYKPELTFRDSTVYYGDIAPTDFSGNLAATKWKHGTNEADPATMGQAPELNLTYTPEAGKIADGKINTKQDIEVDVDVKLGNMDVTEYTTFLHEQCHPACDWDTSSTQGTPAFLLHVKTCQLTITKSGGAADEPYVFGIYKDGEKYTEVTIVGNDSVTISELPVGNYTIQEDTGWSWRYTPSYSGSAVLDAGNPNGSITCTNTSKNDHWLSGFSEVVANIFGIKH